MTHSSTVLTLNLKKVYANPSALNTHMMDDQDHGMHVGLAITTPTRKSWADYEDEEDDDFSDILADITAKNKALTISLTQSASKQDQTNKEAETSRASSPISTPPTTPPATPSTAPTTPTSSLDDGPRSPRFMNQYGYSTHPCWDGFLPDILSPSKRSSRFSRCQLPIIVERDE